MRLIVRCIAACLLAPSPAGFGQELTVNDVLDRWDAGTRLVASYDLYVELVLEAHLVRLNGVDRLTKPGEALQKITYQSHILKDGQKRFGQFTPDPNGHYTSELADDGVTFISAEKAVNNYIIDRGHGPFGSVESEDYEATYRAAYGTADRIALSRERPSRLLPRDGTLYVVDVPTSSTSNLPNMSWRVWLDPARNFMPRRWSEWLDMAGQRTHNIDCTLELAEVAPNVWAVVKSSMAVFNKNKQSAVFGKVMSVDTMTVDMQKSRFNVAIPPEAFTITIPNGASVVDRARNIVYTQGASDPEAYLSKMAAEGNQVLADLSPADRLPRNTIIVPDLPRFWTTGRIVTLIATLLIITAGVIAAGRRWRAA